MINKINTKAWFHSIETDTFQEGIITGIEDCYYIMNDNLLEKHITVFNSLDEVVLKFVQDNRLDLFSVQKIIEKSIFASISNKLFSISLAAKSGLVLDDEFLELSSAVNDLLDHNVSNLKLLKALDNKMIEMGF